MRHGFGWSCLILAVPLASAGAVEPIFESELIFPKENQHNHSSSIVLCANGDLLACWYRGHGERKADDVLIAGSRRRKGASRWSKPFVMADTPGFPDCNPVLFIAPDEKLWLIWPVILNNQWGSALLTYRTSTNYQSEKSAPVWSWQGNILLKNDFFEQRFKDDLARFAAVRKTSEKIDAYFKQVEKASENRLSVRSGWMPRTHPLVLPSGRILLGLYSDVFSISLIAISDDNGGSWWASRPLVGGGNVQPSLVRKKNGTIVAFHRENGISKRIRICESDKDGESWGPVTSSELPNPGSSVEVIATRSGNWVLAYNDTTKGRYSLAVSISEDEGATWKYTRHLEKVKRGQGSYSYPSLIQGPDGILHCTYSFSKGGESIKYARFNEAWIKQGDPQAANTETANP